MTQTADASASVTVAFVDGKYAGMTCTVAGPLTHLGRLYQMNGTADCAGRPAGTGTGAHDATVDALHPTGKGIEGKWRGFVVVGCFATLHFAAVLN